MVTIILLQHQTKLLLEIYIYSDKNLQLKKEA